MPGRGTEVTLRLPLAVIADSAIADLGNADSGNADSKIADSGIADGANADAAKVAPGPSPQAVIPKHILVVEDHDDGREFLRRILHADGHQVDAVGTCAEAREKLASSAKTPYDLMLTDVGLSDGSGWDLVRYVRRKAPDVRVGVITGWAPIADADASHGAEFVLRKPLRAAELQAHIAGRFVPASTTG